MFLFVYLLFSGAAITALSSYRKLDAGCAPEDAHEQAMVVANAARRQRSVGQEREEVEILQRELKEAQVAQSEKCRGLGEDGGRWGE